MTESGTGTGATEQLTLLRSSARAARSRPPRPAPEPAARQPVARVAVDVALPHLDRPFDYLVTAEQADVAQPGVRVRVRFSGRLVDGFLLDRAEASEHVGRLAPLHKVVSAEPVLSPEVLRLAREVADHYAGTLSDVLRLAVPPRHARTEAGPPGQPAAPPERPEPAGWRRYRHGVELLDAVHTGAPARAVWQALPGPAWPDELARLMVTAVAAGRGALAVLPDARDVDRVDAALTALAGPGSHLVLSADLGPAERYRRWLAVRRGTCRAVVGTRAAMFAPVRDLGLAVVWDDGDDLHAEPRAPYPHVRTVLAMRSRLEAAALVVAGWSRTAEAAAYVRAGWARPVVAARDTVRRAAPAVQVAGDEPDGRTGARLPTTAWRAAHQGLEQGPVLVQVPRAGYVTGLACGSCRAPARCPACRGPLGAPAGPVADQPADGARPGAAAAPAGPAAPVCSWCGVVAAGWSCPSCGGGRLRATRVGAARTAEELGRAFPRVPVRVSGGSAPVLARVPHEPAIVVATPGAEPVADGGYAAGLLLDGWALLSRPDLRAAEEALRRWLAAAALVRPAPAGGRVVVLAEPTHPAVQALVRWDPAGFADRELDERATLRLPPEARVVSLTGESEPLQRLLAAAELPAAVQVLGPVTVGEQERFVVRSPRAAGPDLVAALRGAAGIRSAHKEAGAVRIQVDPLEVG